MPRGVKGSGPKPDQEAGRARSSQLDLLLADATDCLLELRRLAGSRKLSADAFLREAMAIAECDEARLKELEAAINKPGASSDYLKAFLRRMVREFSTDRYSRPHPEPLKLLRAVGSEDAAHQIGELRTTVAECQALAAMECVRVHADCFGKIDDYRKHAQRTEALRDRLQNYYQRMRSVVSAHDLHIDMSCVSESERAKGLARVTFRRSPGVLFSQPDWPEVLVRNVLDLVCIIDDQPAANVIAA